MEGGGEASVTPTRIFSGVVKVVTKGGRAYMRTIPDEGDVLIPPAGVGCYARRHQPGRQLLAHGPARQQPGSAHVGQQQGPPGAWRRGDARRKVDAAARSPSS